MGIYFHTEYNFSNHQPMGVQLKKNNGRTVYGFFFVVPCVRDTRTNRNYPAMYGVGKSI